MIKILKSIRKTGHLSINVTQHLFKLQQIEYAFFAIAWLYQYNVRNKTPQINDFQVSALNKVLLCD